MFANSARARTTSSAPPATSVLALMGHSAVWPRGPVTWPFCAMTLFRWWRIQSWIPAPPTFLLYVVVLFFLLKRVHYGAIHFLCDDPNICNVMVNACLAHGNYWVQHPSFLFPRLQKKRKMYAQVCFTDIWSLQWIIWLSRLKVSMTACHFMGCNINLFDFLWSLYLVLSFESI